MVRTEAGHGNNITKYGSLILNSYIFYIVPHQGSRVLNESRKCYRKSWNVISRVADPAGFYPVPEQNFEKRLDPYPT